MEKKKKNNGYYGSVGSSIFLGVMIPIVVMFVVLFGFMTRAWVRKEVILTVDSKWVKGVHGSQKYLVSGKDSNGEEVVYEVTDNLFALRFNSSDIYAGIKEGNTYKMIVGGYRVPLFSWYPNIYSIEKVEKRLFSDSTEAESGELTE